MCNVTLHFTIVNWLYRRSGLFRRLRQRQLPRGVGCARASARRDRGDRAQRHHDFADGRRGQNQGARTSIACSRRRCDAGFVVGARRLLKLPHILLGVVRSSPPASKQINQVSDGEPATRQLPSRLVTDPNPSRRGPFPARADAIAAPPAAAVEVPAVTVAAMTVTTMSTVMPSTMSMATAVSTMVSAAMMTAAVVTASDDRHRDGHRRGGHRHDRL